MFILGSSENLSFLVVDTSEIKISMSKGSQGVGGGGGDGEKPPPPPRTSSTTDKSKRLTAAELYKEYQTVLKPTNASPSENDQPAQIIQTEEKFEVKK